MKYLATILLLQISGFVGLSQDANTAGIMPADSVILDQLQNTNDPEKTRGLTIDLILLSDDKAPLSLLQEARLLYNLAKIKQDQFAEAVALSFYGQGFRITGDFTRAQQYHFKAIELSRKLGDKSLIGYTLNQSAHIYKDREENDKAVGVYRQAAEYLAAGNITEFRFYPYMNLGFVYLNANKPDSALFFSKLATGMLSQLLKNEAPDRREIIERSLYVYGLSNLAAAYSLLQNINEARRYYQQAAAIVAAYSTFKTRYFQFYYFNLARHYQRYHQDDSALYASRMAIQAVAGTPVGYLASGPAKMLSDYYEKRNADSAVKYLKLYLQGNEVMNSTRVTQQLQMMSFEEDQRAVETRRAEKAYRDRIVVYLLIGGLAIMLFVAVYMYRSNIARKRINQTLSEQKTQIEKTLAELKSTQAQLIQSEKMASLGELTAGIAHEIQNPLNFVNNFGEVSSELVDEMNVALNKGDLAEAKAISADIKQNLDKITQHGKRADVIVKGMLQHSRTSSGQRELTDINTLCDEYLRLAYHGLRARDKSFNARFETRFDESLPKISAVPQDISRVLLNLVNNAFYAVNEKAGKGILGYEPTVTVSTKAVEAAAGRKKSVLITVEDNGSGIPEAIRDKIFQPFFTTKPTGQGTGLGLSLAYDIVTKGHGGDIQLETIIGRGSLFTISLPITGQ